MQMQTAKGRRYRWEKWNPIDPEPQPKRWRRAKIQNGTFRSFHLLCFFGWHKWIYDKRDYLGEMREVEPSQQTRECLFCGTRQEKNYE